MDELNWGGGKNRQQKRDKQKQKGSRGKYSSKHVRVHQAMLEKAMKKPKNENKQNGNKKTKNNKNKSKKQKGGANIIGECGPNTKYNPEKCCLPGIKCITPCYQEDYAHDSYPCVDKNGDSRTRELFSMLKCKTGTYNPDECCDETDIGTQCVAPCQSGKNCLDTKGNMPMNKVMKIRAARILMDRLRQLNKERQEKELKAGGINLYQKIVNPLTGRKVSINGKIGKKVLLNYLNLLN